MRDRNHIGYERDADQASGRKSANLQLHQDRIFFRVSVVAWTTAGFAPSQGTVEPQRGLIGGAHFKNCFAYPLGPQSLNQGCLLYTSDAADE